MMPDFTSIVEKIGSLLCEKRLMLGTAESCTGGGLAAVLTSVSGSSKWFERGFVTYSNLAKQELLGVQQSTLAEEGAVSAATAKEMAQGVLTYAPVQISIAITGIAGPDGGSLEKPVGTVYFGFAFPSQPIIAVHRLFEGDRQTIREQAIAFSLHELLGAVDPSL